jgi:hypothetical protein
LAQAALTSGEKVSLRRLPDDTYMTHRNLWVLRVLGSNVRLKTKVDSSSRGQKDFICREEKRKAAWRHAVGPGYLWSHGSGWKLCFYNLLYYPREEMSLWCKQKFPGRQKYLPG